MENTKEKEIFLEHEFPKLLRSLDPATPPKWGKMNVQQMIEHMSDYVRIANGKTPVNLVTEAEKLPRMLNFLVSEKPFPENTPNVLMPDTPAPVRHATTEEAITELHSEIHEFFDVFKKNAGKKITNPFFGDLDFSQQVQLLYKHSTHHLRQFGAIA